MIRRALVYILAAIAGVIAAAWTLAFLALAGFTVEPEDCAEDET